MLYLRSFNRIFGIRLLLIASVMASATAQADTATLEDLVNGATLTEGHALFDNFYFEDDDYSDIEVLASDITLSTSSTASTVRLTTVIDPGLELPGGIGVLDEYFYFLMDFDLSITGGLLQLSSIDLGYGDLDATGSSDAETSVESALGAFEPDNNGIIEIYETVQYGSQTADSHTLGSLITAMDFEVDISGDVIPGSTAGLSTFSLTFNLVEPPPPVPVPAAVWLFGTALIGLVGFSKRRKATFKGW
jgi:hypothetical protein